MQVFRFSLLVAGLWCLTSATLMADLLALYEGNKVNGPHGGIVLDSSGNGNHGVLIGSAGYGDGTDGGALNFNADRSSMVVNTPLTGTFDTIADNQEFSIGFWMAGGDTNPRNSSVFWADGETPNGGNRAIQSHATWSNSNIYLDIGGCCSGTQRLAGPLEEQYIKASVGDEWTHYVYTLDEFGDTYIYINGEVYENVDAGFIAERLGPTDEIPAINKFFIASDNALNNQWEGRMDDFFISDTALTPSEVSQVYSDGVRSVFTGLAAEPAEYTPTGNIGLRLENIGGQLGGAVYVGEGGGDIVAWRVEEIFTTKAGGQEISVTANLAAAGVSGTSAAGDAGTSVLFGDVPLTNTGADDITRTFRIIADLVGGDDPVLGGDFTQDLVAQVTLKGTGGGGGIPELVLKGDIDQSGDVGFGDFLILSANFGATGAAAAGIVPEPSTSSLAMLSLVGFFAVCRRRTR